MEPELKAGGEIETLLSEDGVPPLVVRGGGAWQRAPTVESMGRLLLLLLSSAAAAVKCALPTPASPPPRPRPPLCLLQSGTEGTETFVQAAESKAFVELSIMAGDASVFVIDSVRLAAARAPAALALASPGVQGMHAAQPLAAS